MVRACLHWQVTTGLGSGQLKITGVLLGDETFGGGLFPYLYKEAGGSRLDL